MVSKKSSVIIASIVALFCFLSVAYVSSCTKPGKVINCDNFGCENGGYCYVDTLKDTINGVSHIIPPPFPKCVCPSGYEGSLCATASAAKFVGTWDVNQTVTGSDSVKLVGTDSLYSVTIISTTPTTFMINNLCGDLNYNDVICTIDSVQTNIFTIDTLSAFHMVFDHFKMTTNGYGYIIPNAQIKATLCVKRLNATSNWRHDTLNILMTPHKN